MNNSNRREAATTYIIDPSPSFSFTPDNGHRSFVYPEPLAAPDIEQGIPEEYNVQNYTEQELFQLLELHHQPTDRELEARIYMLIDKYKDIPHGIGKKLYIFFQDVFKYFFYTDEETTSSLSDIEAFQTNPAPTSVPTSTSTSTTTSTTTPTTTNNPPTKAIDYTHQFEYTKGTLNPLLKETTTTLLTIDSNNRSKITKCQGTSQETYTSTSSTYFTIYLSTTLKNVVSFKLLSYSIPFVWDTISDTYGSNFFLLKGNSDGINNGNYDYKISIPSGTYSGDANKVVSAINDSIQTSLISEYYDVSFGNTNMIYYKENGGFASLNVFIQHVFQESNYSLVFPTNDIPPLLGFTQPTYSPHQVYSNYSYLSNLSNNNTYTIDSTNNTIDIILYQSAIDPESNTIGSYMDSSPILKTITITIPNGNTYTETGLRTAINIVLQTKSNMIDASLSKISDHSHYDDYDNLIHDDLFYRYRFSVVFLRKNADSLNINRPNIKTLIRFPSTDTNSIWVGTNSLFKFPNQDSESNIILSETASKTTTFTIDNNPEIFLQCITAPYNQSIRNDHFNITIELQNGTYTPVSWITQLNQDITTANNSAITNVIANTTIPYFSYNNSTGYVSVNMNIQNNITNSFYLDISGSILETIFGLHSTNTEFPKEFPNGIYDTSFNIRPSYSISETTNTFYIRGLKGSDFASIHIPCSIALPPNRYFSDLQTMSNYINNALNNISDNNVKSNSSIIFSYLTNRVLCRLSLNISAQLTNSDYILKFPTNGQNTINDTNWQYLGFSSSTNDISYSFANNAIIAPNKMPSNNVQLTSANNYITFTSPQFPSIILPLQDVETSSIPLEGDCTKEVIIQSLNNALSANVKTLGSYLEINPITQYTLFHVNINNTYSASDYSVFFYNNADFNICNNNVVSHITSDSTLGYLLGFTSSTEYNLAPSNSVAQRYYKTTTTGFTYNPVSQIATLTGDTAVQLNQNTVLNITIDDYVQNHITDSVKPVITSNTNMNPLPSYTNRSNIYCNNGSTIIRNNPSVLNQQNLTTNQIYAANQKYTSNHPIMTQSLYPTYIQDNFAVIYLKQGITSGDNYMDNGGSLQENVRYYFGPVNIDRMTIKLINTKGQILNLKNMNWYFTLQFEILVKSPE